jgi:precorrin-2/cobalt-factor-2 C20-methyltransferase
MNKIYCVGVGPGDPQLLTIKAHGLISKASQIAYFRKRNTLGRARTIVETIINKENVCEYPMEYPLTTEVDFQTEEYKKKLDDFYIECSNKIKILLEKDDLIVISEGDPLFYGSFVHLYEKLKEDIVIVFVPGITAMSGSWTNARIPIAMGDASLSIIMGIQNEKEILRILRFSDSAVIMKIGNHLEKVKNALKKAGSFSRAMIVEKATMSEETIMPLETYKKNKAPYFSIILVPYEVSK